MHYVILPHYPYNLFGSYMMLVMLCLDAKTTVEV
jgi:hypothetical protein